MVVIGYLSAVASRLDEPGILTRRPHTREPDSRLCGVLTLAPTTDGSGWTPERLRWDRDTGWSALRLPRRPPR
jgi:hypothetical protein